jgi:hypothetical protein
MSTSILFAILIFAIASMACLAGTAATSTDNARVTNGNTTTSPAETAVPLAATTMKRIIANAQLDENGNLAWIIAGHWNLESVVSLVVGNCGPCKELSLKLTTS